MSFAGLGGFHYSLYTQEARQDQHQSGHGPVDKLHTAACIACYMHVMMPYHMYII